MRIDIGGLPFVTGDPFADEVVRDAMAFLFQVRFGNTRVGEHGLVIPIYVCGTITWYTHHLELVSKPPYILETVLHRDELRSE